MNSTIFKSFSKSEKLILGILGLDVLSFLLPFLYILSNVIGTCSFLIFDLVFAALYCLLMKNESNKVSTAGIALILGSIAIDITSSVCSLFGVHLTLLSKLWYAAYIPGLALFIYRSDIRTGLKIFMGLMALLIISFPFLEEILCIFNPNHQFKGSYYLTKQIVGTLSALLLLIAGILSGHTKTLSCYFKKAFSARRPAPVETNVTKLYRNLIAIFGISSITVIALRLIGDWETYMEYITTFVCASIILNIVLLFFWIRCTRDEIGLSPASKRGIKLIIAALILDGIGNLIPIQPLVNWTFWEYIDPFEDMTPRILLGITEILFGVLYLIGILIFIKHSTLPKRSQDILYAGAILCCCLSFGAFCIEPDDLYELTERYFYIYAGSTRAYDLAMLMEFIIIGQGIVNLLIFIYLLIVNMLTSSKPKPAELE